MPSILHKLILFKEGRPPGGLPTRSTGRLLAELPIMIRSAISMIFRSRSTQGGKLPAWLHRAADIRLVGIEPDDHDTLLFEAPSLGMAAPKFYQQRDLFWTPPDPEDTGFDLLGDVLVDVAAANTDSLRFDRSLLKRLLPFRDVFRDAFTHAKLSSRRYSPEASPRLDVSLLQSAQRLIHQTPASRRVRVVGQLDMLRVSSQTFALRVGTEEVRGVLLSDNIEHMAPLLNRNVLVFGRAVFRPSGRLLRVDVDEFRPSQDADSFFAKVPKPMGGRPAPRDRDPAPNGPKASLGKWPGDETEEQVRAALEALR